MIFVSVGSREYQFDRLIHKIDCLVDSGELSDKVFAQIGNSNYIPKKIDYTRFLDNDQFSKAQDMANIIISHGGTGALVSALKKDKKVIAVPRLSAFKEHADDHQMQIVDLFEKEGYVIKVVDIELLIEAIEKCKSGGFTPKRFSKYSNIEQIIRDFIISRGD
ncbi:MAG: PssE/Cps14G family polysaccharide biosynthesis glycosyltransferase [Candidatus Izemoplasmatales bacterium]